MRPSGPPSPQALALGLALPVALGMALRLAGLSDQVLGGDELHALRNAVIRPFGELFTLRYGNNAPAVSVFYGALAGLGIPLSETVVRLPMLLCALLVLVLVPRLLAPRIGRDAAGLLAWMLAVSPVLILYSRIARSYMPVVLLGFVAALSAWAWLRSDAPRHALAYAVCGALAIYLHLGMAPFVLAAAAFAAGVRIQQGGLTRRRIASLALLVGGVLLGTAVLLLPSVESVSALVGGVRRTGEERPEVGLTTLLGVARLVAGTAQPLGVALFAAASLRGTVWLLRRERRFALYALWLCGVQVAGLLVLAPVHLHQPIVFGRYLLVAQPLLLAFAAVGLAAPVAEGAGRRGRRIQLAGAGALLAALVALGPLAQPAFWSPSLQHHNDYVGFHRPRGTLPDDAVPAFYRALAEGSPDAAIIEFPWSTAWNYGRSLRVYQELHGRRVVVSGWEPWLGEPVLRLRNHVPPEPDAWLASDARFAVVHLDLSREETRVREAPGSLASDLHPKLSAAVHHDFGVLGAHQRQRLTRAWGPPDSEDGAIAVWDLQRIREAGRR